VIRAKRKHNKEGWNFPTILKAAKKSGPSLINFLQTGQTNFWRHENKERVNMMHFVPSRVFFETTAMPCIIFWGERFTTILMR